MKGLGHLPGAIWVRCLKSGLRGRDSLEEFCYSSYLEDCVEDFLFSDLISCSTCIFSSNFLKNNMLQMGNGKQQCRQDLSQATKSRLDFQQTSSWIDLQMWTSLLVDDPMIIRYYEYKQRDPMIIYMFHDYCMILDKLYYAYYRHRVPFSAGSGGLFHMNFRRCPKKGNPLDQKKAETISLVINHEHQELTRKWIGRPV